MKARAATKAMVPKTETARALKTEVAVAKVEAQVRVAEGAPDAVAAGGRAVEPAEATAAGEETRASQMKVRLYISSRTVHRATL